MSKFTDRVTARVAPEDKAWLDAEAERLGVDISDVLRMMVRQARLGASVVVTPPQFARAAVIAPVRDILDVGTAEMAEEEETARADDEGDGNSAADADTLVAQRLREADERGLTKPWPAPAQAYEYPEDRVRSLRPGNSDGRLQISRRSAM